MNKIWLIIVRDYQTRVSNRAFILLTLLAPVMFAAIFKVYDSPVKTKGAVNPYLFLSLAGSLSVYFVIFFYSIRTMQGVIEEKASRVIEIIVSAVKPFQLMVGKIIGITLVVFTQVITWIVLTIAVVGLWNGISGAPPAVPAVANTQQVVMAAPTPSLGDQMKNIPVAVKVTEVTCYILFLLGGFLLYGALFAAIGAAVDSDTDTMQFMIPVALPLIFALTVVPSVFKDPHNDVAVWTSIIPFTSPVVMMMRIPFGVPLWQLLLSIVSLFAGFIFTTMVAAKVYRVGLLSYGKKVRWGQLMNWLVSRD